MLIIPPQQRSHIASVSVLLRAVKELPKVFESIETCPSGFEMSVKSAVSSTFFATLAVGKVVFHYGFIPMVIYLGEYLEHSA